MLDRDGIRRRAVEVGLGEWADHLAAVAPPSIRLHDFLIHADDPGAHDFSRVRIALQCY